MKSAVETVGGVEKWKQAFKYDRFGNKNFDAANTTILSSESSVPKVANPEVLPNSNKYKEDQDGDSQPDYLYDASGNVTKNARQQNFTYDAENRQITAIGASLSTSYAYDGNGKRVKSHNSVTNQTTIFVYDADGDLAAEYTINVPPPTTPTISYLTEDALGSVRVITDSFGGPKSRRDFLPFGEEIYSGIGSRNTDQKYSLNGDDTRKKFATYQRDAETGLDFAQSRYYSPMQGRFTSPDEFKGGPDELFDFEDDASGNPTLYADLANPQSLNKYQYGYSNPYKYNDPDGHCPDCKNGKPAFVAPLLIPAIVAVVAILTGPDTVNAPGPNDPVYKSEKGANVFFGLLGFKGGAGVLTAVGRGAAKEGLKTPIKGYTKHGLNQAISRNGGKGVKPKAMLDAVRKPKKVTKQTNGTTKYKGQNATVILNDKGKVVTTFGKPRGPRIRPEGTKRPSGSGPAQRKANKRGFSYNPNVIR